MYLLYESFRAQIYHSEESSGSGNNKHSAGDSSGTSETFVHKKKPKYTHDPADLSVVVQSSSSGAADTQLGSPLTCGRHRKSGSFTESVFKRTSKDWRRDYLISNYPQIHEAYYNIICSNYTYFQYLFENCCDDAYQCDAVATLVVNEIIKRQETLRK